MGLCRVLPRISAPPPRRQISSPAVLPERNTQVLRALALAGSDASSQRTSEPGRQTPIMIKRVMDRTGTKSLKEEREKERARWTSRSDL